jgi:hypothetical protein
VFSSTAGFSAARTVACGVSEGWMIASWVDSGVGLHALRAKIRIAPGIMKTILAGKENDVKGSEKHDRLMDGLRKYSPWSFVCDNSLFKA